METTMNNIRPGTSDPAAEARLPRAASRPAGRPGDDVVRRSEFRLALSMGAFALTVMLGCFGFMYQASADLRVAMDAQITGCQPACRSLPPHACPV